MFGTIAKYSVKPGHDEPVLAAMKRFGEIEITGHLHHSVYRSQQNPQEIWIAVVFEDEAAYRANADSPVMTRAYQGLKEHLDGEVEWHDGEVVMEGARSVTNQPPLKADHPASPTAPPPPSHVSPQDSQATGVEPATDATVAASDQATQSEGASGEVEVEPVTDTPETAPEQTKADTGEQASGGPEAAKPPVDTPEAVSDPTEIATGSSDESVAGSSGPQDEVIAESPIIAVKTKKPRKVAKTTAKVAQSAKSEAGGEKPESESPPAAPAKPVAAQGATAAENASPGAAQMTEEENQPGSDDDEIGRC